MKETERPSLVECKIRHGIPPENVIKRTTLHCLVFKTTDPMLYIYPAR